MPSSPVQFVTGHFMKGQRILEIWTTTWMINHILALSVEKDFALKHIMKRHMDTHENTHLCDFFDKKL